jgi:hypothetical protein
MVATSNDVGDCTHAMVPQVTITGVDLTTVTFQVRSASKSGNVDEALLRTFTVALSDVYRGATTKLPVLPVPLTPGATGVLYLSHHGWQTMSSDGFAIFDANRAVFKWPDCAGVATAICSKLSVVPSSIVVRGHLEGEVEIVEIELLGPDAAAAQHIVWNGASYLALQLTEQGAGRLHVKSRSTQVGFWPTRIVVRGAPVIDPEVSGDVDLLNSELSDSAQHLVFAKHGAPIELSLTQDGFTAFHVTPQAVAEHMRDLETAPHAHARRA